MQNIDSEIELFDRNLDVLQAFGNYKETKHL